MSDVIDKFLDDMQVFVDRENARLLSAFKDRDIVQRELISWVLLFHLQTEQLLERIIVARLPRARPAIENDNLRFYHKLQLVDWLDVATENVVEATSALNTLRNRCAHRSSKTISIEDLDTIGRPLGTLYSEARAQPGKDLFKLTKRVCNLVYAGLLGGVYKCEHLESVASVENAEGDDHEA